MDIAGISTALASVDLQSQVGTAVLSKAMDSNEQIGAGIVEMIDSAAMELSVNPHIGANMDIRI